MTFGRRFEVYSHSELIGWSEFEHRDPSMGVAFGRFIPAVGYGTIREAVRATLTNGSRVDAQKHFALTIRTPTGVQIPAQYPASISDGSTAAEPDDIEIEMLGVPDFERFFPTIVGRDA
jgi:hypothetical protein